MIAKYLAISFAMENVVSEPRVISICLPMPTISINLVGFESRSTMLPASLAACVPLFIATATSAWARAGASFVPSPHIATRRFSACMSRMYFSFALGRGFGQEVVDARLGRDRRGGQRVVAGDHHRADTHLAHLGEALLDAVLDDVLQLHDTEGERSVDHDERGRATTGDILGHALDQWWQVAVLGDSR